VALSKGGKPIVKTLLQTKCPAVGYLVVKQEALKAATQESHRSVAVTVNE
jgi:hypothetical protein